MDHVLKLVQFAFHEGNTGVDVFETVADSIRHRLLALLGSPSGGIAFGPSVSYLSSQASRWWDVRERRTVLCLKDEHPSAWLPWIQAGFDLRPVRAGRTQSATDALEEAINESTAVVIASECHWHHGARMDLERISLQSMRMGARLIVDASQSVGVIDSCWRQIDADLVVFSSQKWLFGAPGLACAFVPDRNLHRPPLDTRPSGFLERVENLSPSLMTPTSVASRLDSACISRAFAIPILDKGLDAHQDKPAHYWEGRHRAWQSAVLDELERSRTKPLLIRSESPHITAFKVAESRVDHAREALLRSSLAATIRAGWIRISPDLRQGDPDPRRVAEAILFATGPR